MSINLSENIAPENDLFCATSANDAIDVSANLPGGDNPKSGNALSRELADAWLTWQCQMVAGIIRGAVFLPDEFKPGRSAAIWPTEGNCEPQLVAAATQASKKNGSVKFSKIGYGPDKQRICDLVACPILLNDTTVAIVAVAISIRSEPQQHAVLQLLRWGGLWVETLIREQHEYKRHNLAFPQKLLSTVLTQPTSETAIVEAVNQFASEFACERVSIGLRKGPLVILKSLSHISRFDPRTQFVRAIENAMEESLDQGCTIVYPESSQDTSMTNNRSHSALATQHGTVAICTLGLQGQSNTFGALCLERSSSQPFNNAEVLMLEYSARQLGLVLELKQQDECSIWQKALSSVLKATGSLFGTTYLKLKLFLLAIVVLLLVISVIDGTHKVTAPSSIEGAVRQLLVAPQDGYIKQAHFRAGDEVKKGQLIASLDDRNLQLELQKWQSERNQVEKKYLNALASGDRTEVGINKAQLDQVDAEIQLTSNALEQTRLTAPFDGVVVSGDLSQSLGAPIENGQVLFEVGLLNNYRVVLEVDEHDVDGISVGKSGHMIVAALPQSSFEFTVNQIIPLAVSGESGNYFRVEASLEEPSELLRPGMRGVAKVELGERNLLWIWTHTLLDRIRLWAWSVGL